jgi:hypothetical protein
MPLTLSGTGGITYPDGSVNASRSISAAGDTMTGALNVPANATGTQVPRLQEVVKKSGDTMTGSLSLPGLVINANTDFSPSGSGTGHIEVQGNGYTGFVTLNATGMFIGHNSTGRNTSLMVNETTRLALDNEGNASIGDGTIRGGYIALGVGTARLLYGGVGAATTGGTTNWNHISNAHSGSGFCLLLGNHANGPGPATYYHSWCFEYSEKSGTGNMTQWAIGYNSSDRYQRTRYQDVWSSWSAF